MIKYATRTLAGDPIAAAEHAGDSLLYCIDTPSAQTLLVPYFDELLVEGWAASPRMQTASLHWRLNQQAWHTQAANIPRPDVQSYCAGLNRKVPEAVGFSLRIDLSALGTDSCQLELRFEDGWSCSETETIRLRRLDLNAGTGSAGKRADSRLALQHEQPIAKRSGGLTLARIERLVGIESSDVLVDLGCGDPALGRQLAAKCGQWLGVELDRPQPATADRSASNQANTQVICCAPGEALAAIATASVDLLYSAGIFNSLHPFERFELICQARRVLRPSGRIIVDAVNVLSDAGWNEFVAASRGESGLTGSVPLAPSELLNYFKRAGFNSLRYEEEGGWLFVWASNGQ